jgi:hypothetical protein
MSSAVRNIKGAAPVLVLALAVACQGGGGCGDCTGTDFAPYPAPPPAGGEVLSEALRVRVTQSTLDFLRRHITLILGSSVTMEGDRAVFYIDETRLAPDGALLMRDGCIGDNVTPCPAPSRRSKVSLDLSDLTDRLVLEWLPPTTTEPRPGVRFSLRDIEVFLDLTIVTNVPSSSGLDLKDAVCHVRDAGELAAVRLAEFGFDLRFSVDDSGGAPVLDAEVVDLAPDFGGTGESSVINLLVSPCHSSRGDGTCDDPLCACDDPACAGANPALEHCDDVCGLVDLFAQLSGFITALLEPLLEELAPELGDAISEGLLGTVGALPLSLETQLQLPGGASSIFDGATPLALKLGLTPALTVAPSPTSSTWLLPGRGLELVLDTGVATATVARCAAGVAPPPLSVGPAPSFSGFVEIVDSLGQSHFEMYHLVATLAEAQVSQILWTAFQSGALCMTIDAGNIQWLAGTSFPFTAALLETFDQRLGGLAASDAALAIALTPRGPPLIRLGAGHEVATGVLDPLIQVTLDDLDLDVYLSIDGAPSRVAGLTVDVALNLAIERTPVGGLEVVIAGMEILESRSTYNELAPNVDMAELVLVVADFVLDTMLGDSARFALPFPSSLESSLGMDVSLRFNTVRRDLGPGVDGSPYLSLYISMCGGEDMADPDNITCYDPAYTLARDSITAGLRLADTESLYVAIDPERWSAAPSGRALLAVDFAGDADTLELSFQVDGGAFSTFRPLRDGMIEIASPKLRVLGRHTIGARLRAIGVPSSQVSVTPIDVWVDREAPRLSVRYDGATIAVTTSDFGARDVVEVLARRSPAEGWLRLTSGTLDVSGWTGAVEVVARDLAGNTTVSRVELDTSPSAGPTRDRALDGGEPADGCSATPRALGFLAALLALARRSRR